MIAEGDATIFAPFVPALREPIVTGTGSGVEAVASKTQWSSEGETRVTVAPSSGRCEVLDRYARGWYEIVYEGVAVTSGPELVSSTVHRLHAGDLVEVVSLAQVGSRTRGLLHALPHTEGVGWISIAAARAAWVWAKPVDELVVSVANSSYTRRPTHTKSVENRISLRVAESKRLDAEFRL